MLFAISSHATFRSLWLISVPAAPASRRASGGVHPVVGPGSTASTCCANTGTWTSFATCAISVVGGQRTIDAPVSSAAAAKRFARSQPFLPKVSGWVLKFRTIAGRRMDGPKAMASEIGLAATGSAFPMEGPRSEEHTSELQSPMYLVCRLLLEKKTN